MGYLPVMVGEPRYDRIESIDSIREKEPRASPYLLLLPSVIFSLAFGFFLGYMARMQLADSSAYGVVHVESTNLAFKYNDTFSLPPDNYTNTAWDDIFPPGAGFITHPQLSPNISGLAVFHQLHCINQLRLGFYQTETRNLGFSYDPAHARHCFDYLRQSIMCAADSNIEPIVNELNGISGWGNQRVCRDFEGLAEWAERWKATNDHGSGLGI